MLMFFLVELLVEAIYDLRRKIQMLFLWEAYIDFFPSNLAYEKELNNNLI
jgi:hypothetical protein